MSRSNDESLSPEGLLDVQQVVAERSPTMEYDMVFSSPLKRAAETAAEFARAKEIRAQNHDAMLEREFGILSNKTWDEIDQITKGALNYAIWHENMEHDLSPFGGESKELVRERIQKFIDHLKTNHPDAKPLVVTHGGVLRTLYALFPDHIPETFKNVSIHEFEI